MIDYQKEMAWEKAAISYPEAKQRIAALEAFRGYEPEEYLFLIDPLTKFMVSSRCQNLDALNEFARAILGTKPGTIYTENEPSITAKFLADLIRPWVEDIREKLFHSKSAPFRSASDAKKWLEKVNKKLDEWGKRVGEWQKEVDEWHKRVDKWREKANEYHDYYQAILERYPHLKGGIEEWLLMKKQGVEVEFPPKEEWQKLTEIKLAADSLDSKIGEVGEPPEQSEEIKTHYAFGDSVLEICQVTGFTKQSVEMYILADAQLILPPFTLGIVKETHSLPSGVDVLNRYASVTIRGGMTFKELLSLYRSIRRGLGIKRSKPLTKKNLELYEIVTRKGNIPNRKGTIEPFWESIRKEWNAHHARPKYKTWKVVQITYGRIKARLERRIVAKEAQNERKHKAKRQE